MLLLAVFGVWRQRRSAKIAEIRLQIDRKGRVIANVQNGDGGTFPAARPVKPGKRSRVYFTALQGFFTFDRARDR